MTVKAQRSLDQTEQTESLEQPDRIQANERKVLAIFRDTLEVDVDVDTDVIANGMLDSLAFVKLLVELESQFGMEVDLSRLDLEDFGSVARIARLVPPGEDGTR